LLFLEASESKKATRDDDVPGDVLKLLGESGLNIMTKLINTICETGEWPKDLTEVAMIALREEATSYKMRQPLHNQPYRTYRKDN
jgi:hypothetical protein